VLVVLAAGKGTRFGQDPKCIQPVRGTPLARHSIDAFRHVSPAPAVCLVGYRHREVAADANDNIYVLSDNLAGTRSPRTGVQRSLARGGGRAAVTMDDPSCGVDIPGLWRRTGGIARPM
jgi:molybdenum cofactor cytidylyltransferase